MKKLISLCLVLVMVLTTAAPVLAAPLEDPGDEKSAYVFDPEVQAWIDAHPQEVEEFRNGGIDVYLAKEHPWYDSVADMAEIWGESEAYIRDALLESWILDVWAEEEYQAELAAFEEAHPGMLAWFESNAYDYFAQEYYWYNSPEQYMERWELTEEEFIVEMVKEQFFEFQAEEKRQTELAAFEEAHPGMLAWFESNAYDYFAQEYHWYDSPQEYMEYQDLTEEEFIAQMVKEQMFEVRAEDARKAWINERKTELGGVPGQIGVRLNNQYITFPDAAPELVDGRVMAPYRALMEAMGGEIAYDETTRTATCVLGDAVLTLPIGESALTIREDGTVTTVEMDCAAYVKDGRTYVPVRFVSQAFGYDVFWDQSFETAVVLDGAALAAQIDEQFTILNRAISFLLPDPEQTLSVDSTVQAKLTLFDSISGDQTLDFSAAVQSLTRNGSGQAEVQMDLSSLVELLELDDFRENGSYDAEELALMEALLDSLRNLSLEVIVDGETGVYYVRSPLFELLDEDLADAWVAGQGIKTGISLDNLTVGSFCYQMTTAGISSRESLYDVLNDWDSVLDYPASPVCMYEWVLSSGEQLAGMVGDGCFTHSDQGDTITLTPESLGIDPEFSYNPFSKLNFTITVADSGAVSGSFIMEILEDFGQTLLGSSAPSLLMDCTFDLGESRRSLTLELHVKNAFRLELEAEDAISVSDAEPVTAPPAGSKIVDMDDI